MQEFLDVPPHYIIFLTICQVIMIELYFINDMTLLLSYYNIFLNTKLQMTNDRRQLESFGICHFTNDLNAKS